MSAVFLSRLWPLQTGKMKLRVFSHSGILLREYLHRGAEQLRAQQGSDFHKLYVQDLKGLSSTPKPMKGKSVMTYEELEEVIKEKQSRLAAAAAEAEKFRALQAQAGELPAPEEPQNREEEEVEEEPEFEGYDGVGLPALLPSQQARLEKEQRKAKAKPKPKQQAGKDAKGQWKGQSRRVPSLRSSTPPVVTPHPASVTSSAHQSIAITGSDDLSSATPGSIDSMSVGSATAKTTLTGYAKWSSQISIAALLAGATTMGRLYDCRRNVDSMEKTAKTASELAELHATREFCNIGMLCKDQSKSLSIESHTVVLQFLTVSFS